MPDSNTTKNYKLISMLIVLCVVGSYLGILFIVQMFTGSSSLAHLLNSKHTMNKHQEELMEKILRDPHFNNIGIDEYISEVEKIITMENKRSLGKWVSFKSFTPNVSGKYITTNDYGMRSKWNLKEMVQRARNNRSKGVRNIIILGGSVAFGYGAVDDKNTISGVLNNMLKEDGYEVFNLAQGGYTSFMDLFSLSAIGLYLEPDIIIVMEGYADTYHLFYESRGGELAWGLFSESEKQLDPEFSLNFHYQNLDAILRLGSHRSRKVILALQPLSGFENNSIIENEKIKKMWGFYPRIREMMQLAAKNNNSKFIDLSVIFKKEKNSSINFFDKAHLTGSGQKKVAEFLVKTIKNLSDQKSKYVDLFQSREEQIKNILEEDFSGQYKTVEDY
jgi:hypothetical protein